jgi:hypothetical protein
MIQRSDVEGIDLAFRAWLRLSRPSVYELSIEIMYDNQV